MDDGQRPEAFAAMTAWSEHYSKRYENSCRTCRHAIKYRMDDQDMYDNLCADGRKLFDAWVATEKPPSSRTGDKKGV